MTYETAPATQILASSCAACGRPLVDAVSVETGMGPDCRAKYSYGEAQTAPDYAKASRMLALESAATAEELTAWNLLDARSFANKLVHRVACNRFDRPAVRSACIVAVDALGFNRLARKLATHIRGICIEERGDLLVVRAPFSPDFNEAVRSVRGSRWNRDLKVREVPASSRASLWEALKKSFPAGTPVFGAKGSAIL